MPGFQTGDPSAAANPFGAAPPNPFAAPAAAPKGADPFGSLLD